MFASSVSTEPVTSDDWEIIVSTSLHVVDILVNQLLSGNPRFPRRIHLAIAGESSESWAGDQCLGNGTDKGSSYGR